MKMPSHKNPKRLKIKQNDMRLNPMTQYTIKQEEILQNLQMLSFTQMILEFTNHQKLEVDEKIFTVIEEISQNQKVSMTTCNGYSQTISSHGSIPVRSTLKNKKLRYSKPTRQLLRGQHCRTS